MILAVDLGLRDAEDVVQQEGTEVRNVVAFPVFNAALEILDSRVVLRPSLRLVDLISDALCGGDPGLQLVGIRIIGVVDGFEKRLSSGTCDQYARRSTRRARNYLQE